MCCCPPQPHERTGSKVPTSDVSAVPVSSSIIRRDDTFIDTTPSPHIIALLPLLLLLLPLMVVRG